jgi:lipopolysaccharide export LptBFGC system permease protein LptF
MSIRTWLVHGVGVPSAFVSVGQVLFEIAPEAFIATSLGQNLLAAHLPFDASLLTPLALFFGVLYLLSILDRIWNEVTNDE